MLKQRVITALVLLAVIALVVSASSPWPFLVFLAVGCGCAGWEWVRLTRPGSSSVAVLTGILLFAGALLQAWFWLGGVTARAPWQAPSSLLLMHAAVLCSVVVWLSGVAVAVARGQADAPARSLVWTLFAPVALYSTWAALAYLFMQRGAWFVLSLLMLIWVADIGAYFAGKAFGRHKLAPRISPGKTLEGAVAGVVGVVIWVLVSARWPDTFGHALVTRWSWLGAAGFAVILAVVSIMGDLFESLLKRRAGIKDSSGLLPGHGGVYDRIDAVVAVVPLAFVLVDSASW